MNRFKLFVLSGLLVFSCSSNSADDDITNIPENPSDSELYFPPLGGSDWETVNPEDIGWDTSYLNTLDNFLDQNNTRAFIILKNGRLAYERYFNNWSAEMDHPWYSAGKTLTALTLGIALEEGYLNLDDPSNLYLGNGWSSLTEEQESAITVKDHISMTTGLDYTNPFILFCTLPECLNYLNAPGTTWYYHNAPYTLSQGIIDGAIGEYFESYFNSKIKDRIGMNGFWQPQNFNKIYNSTARSMAKFGLLIQNRGRWNETDIINDTAYFEEMTNTSQAMNPSYGYLWWLNGKSGFRLPGSTESFPGPLIPNAPNDLIAGLGFSDQKLYVIPSLDMVIVRLGEAADSAELGPSGFDNDLWQILNLVFGN